jgi:Ca-activated chloride channel homolog
VDATAGVTFQSPHLLWALLLLVPAAVFLHRRERERRKLANRFVSERMRGILLPARIFRPMVLCAGFAALVVAFAGPRYGVEEQEIAVPEAALVILLDTSLSMNAEDLGTSRLSAAKAVIQRVLQRFPGRAALIVFEGSAEVVAPLTDDTEAIVTLLESVGAGELEEAGSNLRTAISAGLELVRRSGLPSAVMLLISDGEHRAEDLDDVLSNARERNVPIVTALTGTEQGAMIPSADGDVIRQGGQPVITRADPTVLSLIADRTGGAFVDNPFSEPALRALSSHLGESARAGSAKREILSHRNRYQVPLAIALAFLLGASWLNRGAE